MKHLAESAVLIAFFVFMYFIWTKDEPGPANTETLTCVRVKQVTPAGTINYLCEVRK